MGRPTFQCVRRLGNGNFGLICQGRDVATNDTNFAVKIEEVRPEEPPQLKGEYEIALDLQNEEGFAQVYYFGTPADRPGNISVMVMELLGPNLEEMFDLCNRRFSVKTTCMLALQLLTRMETLHGHGVIFRDTKPENFLTGRRDTGHDPTIYMVDFGLATRYIRDGKHVAFRKGNSMIGTARYMSINAHRKCEQSRRDDLEALGHMLVYFLRGSLPWQGLRAPNAEARYRRIADTKMAVPIDTLCAGLPGELAEYLHYARDLGFDEDPDYDYLRGLFRTICVRNGWPIDYTYDWSDLPLPVKPLSTPQPPPSKAAQPQQGKEKGKDRGRTGAQAASGQGADRAEENDDTVGCFCFRRRRRN